MDSIYEMIVLLILLFVMFIAFMYHVKKSTRKK